jgi:hypothetical protein
MIRKLTILLFLSGIFSAQGQMNISLGWDGMVGLNNDQFAYFSSFKLGFEKKVNPSCGALLSVGPKKWGDQLKGLSFDIGISLYKKPRSFMELSAGLLFFNEVIMYNQGNEVVIGGDEIANNLFYTSFMKHLSIGRVLDWRVGGHYGYKLRIKEETQVFENDLKQPVFYLCTGVSIYLARLRSKKVYGIE